MKKINIVGCSLYSIFLSILLRKLNKRIEINIFEKTKYFLNSYNSIKIDKYKLNPGFHAFENVRSKNLLNFLKNFIKLKKVHSKRGILIDEFLISFDDQITKWPNKIINNYNLNEKEISIKLKDISKILPKKYLKYHAKNLGDDRSNYNNFLSLIYPWFYPKNYKLKSLDEGNIFNQKIRNKLIKHSFVFPKNGLFSTIGFNFKKIVKLKNINFYKNTSFKFEKKEKEIIIYKNDIRQRINKNEIYILCTPIIPLSFSIIKNHKILKAPPIKMYTGLIKINYKEKNVNSKFDNFIEIIVSSQYAKGLKRIANYSLINSIKETIFQIEFVEHNSYSDLKKQVKSIENYISKMLKKYSNSGVNTKVLGISFIRNTFSPKSGDIDSIKNNVENFFKTSKGVKLYRSITWPVNTNKQYIYANQDKKKVLNDIKYLV